MPRPDPVDPNDVDHVSRCITRALLDRNVLKGEIKKRDREIEKLREQLKVAQEWQGRLHEKCMALEAIPGGVLDGWDERYLLDHDASIHFKRLPGGRRRVVLERRGYARLVKNGRAGDVFLRELIEEASGRKRTSPQQQAAS